MRNQDNLDYDWQNILDPNYSTGVNLLKTVCEKHCISTTVCVYACQLLAKRRKDIKPSNVSNIAAFCFYESSKHFNADRTFFEICCMFQITPKMFNSNFAVKKLTSSIIDESLPSFSLERIMFHEKLLFKDKMEIGKRADKIFEKVNAGPNVVLAYVIYEFFQEKPYLKKMSMQRASTLCNVSTTSLKRFRKSQSDRK